MALSTLYVTDVKADARQLYATPDDLLTDPAHVISANAVQANQRSGTIQQRLNASPLDKLTVQWGIDTDGTQACSDDCEITGEEGDALQKDIDAPLCQEITAAVSEETIRRLGLGDSPEAVQRAAQAELSRKLAVNALKMDTWVNMTTVTALKALHGAPRVGTAAGVGTVGGDSVIGIPTANYNRKIVGELMKMARLNQMGSAYLLDGGQLFVDWFNATIDGANDTGKGDAARVKFFKEYFDLEGFMDAAITEDTFIIKPGAVGLFYKTFLPNTPRKTEAGQVWTNFKSANILDMTYDLIFEEKCSMVGSHPVTTHIAKLKAHVGIHTAAGVDAVRPGLLLAKAV